MIVSNMLTNKDNLEPTWGLSNPVPLLKMGQGIFPAFGALPVQSANALD